MKTDKKDIEVLRILDENFRVPLSQIAKNVGLSKNSVSLRFRKLQSLMLHNATGINNRMLGYALVKILYVIDSFDNPMENKITFELKKHKQVVYAARLYGHYNLEVALFVKDFDDLAEQINTFNAAFSKYITEKDVEVVMEEFFFCDNFLFDKPPCRTHSKIKSCKRQEITDADKKILILLRIDPRKSILDIAAKTRLNPKTVMHRMKAMEKKGIITGYFMMLDYSKFGLSTFKLLIKVNNLIKGHEFDKYLSSLKNMKHFSKMLGLWDYEADVLYPSVLELQNDIELLKQAFPRQIKKIEIINHGKRIVTNKEKFLI